MHEKGTLACQHYVHAQPPMAVTWPARAGFGAQQG